MSETIHSVLDFSLPVGTLSFKEVFTDLDSSSPDNIGVRLTQAQLNALIKVLFTYSLHYDEISTDQRPTFMESIKENINGIFDIPLSFCGHLLNNLDKGATSEFHRLLELEYDLKNLLSNEALMDFVEMELIDPTVSYRKWEYGRYALYAMANGFMAEMDWEAERSRLAWYKIGMEDYVEDLDKFLDSFHIDLDDHEKGLLLLMVNAKVREQKSSLVEYVLAGDIIQSNLVGLQLRKNQMASVLKTTIENARSRGRDRGGPKL